MPVHFFILTSVLLNVCGQLAIKFGTNKSGALQLSLHQLPETLKQIISNPFILGGLFLYAVSALFWIVALSKAELSYAYPFLSIGYVLIILLSAALLHENVTSNRLLGIGLIVLGLIFIARR